MIHHLKPGNIYKVNLGNGIIRFFQFIGKDSSDLNSDVIRIFARPYNQNDSVTISDIVNDTVECYMHTFIIVGLELKLWEFFAASKELGSLDIYFRTSEDFVLSPGPAFVSHKWVVWKMNCNRVFVGTLAKEYWSASIGGVYAPIHVLYRLNTGEIPDRLYPGY